MTRKVHNLKFFLYVLAVLILSPLIVYFLYGHKAVAMGFNDPSFPIISRFVTFNAAFDLEHYIKYANTFFFVCYLLWVGTLGFISYVISKWGFAKCLKGLLFFFYLFIILELFMRLFFSVANKNIDAYRYFSFNRSPMIVMPDPHTGERLIPNVSRNAFTSDFKIVYETNSLGMRDREIEGNELYRVLFLGDSQTFGEGVEFGKRFTDLLGNEMEEYYVMNAAVLGYGIHQMYEWLKHYGLQLKPNLVICSIIKTDLDRAVFNDLGIPPYTSPQDRISSKAYISQSLKKIEKYTAKSLKISYLFSYFYVRIKIILMRNTLADRDKKEWDTLLEEGYHRGRDWIEEREVVIHEKVSSIISNFRKLAEANGFSFLIVNIDTVPIPWLENILKEKKMTYLDLSPKIKKLTDRTFEIDQHYNEKTHAFIAEELKSYLLHDVQPK